VDERAPQHLLPADPGNGKRTIVEIPITLVENHLIFCHRVENHYAQLFVEKHSPMSKTVT